MKSKISPTQKFFAVKLFQVLSYIAMNVSRKGDQMLRKIRFFFGSMKSKNLKKSTKIMIFSRNKIFEQKKFLRQKFEFSQKVAGIDCQGPYKCIEHGRPVISTCFSLFLRGYMQMSGFQDLTSKFWKQKSSRAHISNLKCNEIFKHLISLTQHIYVPCM